MSDRLTLVTLLPLSETVTILFRRLSQALRAGWCRNAVCESGRIMVAGFGAFCATSFVDISPPVWIFYCGGRPWAGFTLFSSEHVYASRWSRCFWVRWLILLLELSKRTSLGSNQPWARSSYLRESVGHTQNYSCEISHIGFLVKRKFPGRTRLLILVLICYFLH